MDGPVHFMRTWRTFLFSFDVRRSDKNRSFIDYFILGWSNLLIWRYQYKYIRIYLDRPEI